jgi:UDP-2-acetamido-2-deoxy-ribo-hexuluronate aminotransferase
METIQMVDLQNQYLKIKSEIDAAIAEVLKTSKFIRGQQVEQFEQELAAYLDVKYVISCANGTDALMLSLMALGLQPGDEVITPSFTFIATAETIAFLGLKPIFAEVDPKTFNIDPEKIKKLITPKTKAIIPVHLFGQCADMTSILRIAEKNNLFIVEDAAQSLGATFAFPCGTLKKAGTFGQLGCTSFFPSKNLGCFGDGGAVFTNNEILAKKIKLIANHGMAQRYNHEVIGVNSRLDTLQAAVLNVKLKYLDKFNKERIVAANYYTDQLKSINEISVPTQIKQANHIYNQYTIKVSGNMRDKLRQYLETKSIPTMVYYPIPLHLQPAFKYLGLNVGSMSVTEKLCNEVLSLPMHTELSEEQLSYICSTVKDFFKSN